MLHISLSAIMQLYIMLCIMFVLMVGVAQSQEASENCQNTTRADIILILDSSTSIGPVHWKEEIRYVSRLVNSFSVGPNDVRFAAVVFNHGAVKLFDLKTFSQSTAVADALMSIPYPDTRGTNTHLALAKVKEDRMFGTLSGGRYIAKDVVIVLTDGRSKHPAIDLKEVETLRSSGVNVLTVGIGDVDKEELSRLANRSELVFTSNDQRLVDYIKEEFSVYLCEIQNVVQDIKF